MRLVTLLTVAWLILGSTGSLFAQGVQTGTLRGIVRDQQDLAVPGVTVTATSAALQGPRSTVTDVLGLYAIPALPPGDYQVVFELSGFATVTRMTVVPLGLTVAQDVSLRPAGVAETVQVTGALPAPIETPIVGANYKQEEIESLATPRTIEGIAQFSPAVTQNGPQQGTEGGSTGQIVINGALAYDNVFMINGVDVNDNLFATPQNLFVEDAIEETQVLTSGISAEYGRFTGGVINAITKSGGNSFSGTGRINFQNPSWTTETPFETCEDKTIAACTTASEHLDVLSRTYEGTLGGPIMRDRVWFFTSGRSASLSSSTTLPVSGVQVPQTDKNKRGEIKLTGTVRQGHTVQGAYLNDPRTRTNNSGAPLAFIIDRQVLVNRENPNWYSYGNYKGVLRNNLLAEAQYSERRFEFKNEGGTSLNIVDSPFVGVCQCTFYNAPYFDATDPEQRNNRQFTGNVTNFWNGAGRHETKYGYEFFRSQRTGGGSQSSTGYVFWVDYLPTAAGPPALDANGRLIPVFVPDRSQVHFHPAVRGATMNVDNNSAFAQDHWTISDRWSADLGVRFESVKAVSTGDIVSIDNTRVVPRLAVAHDLAGNGDRIVHVTYGQYSGRYNERMIGANSPVGRAAEISSTYRGPAGQGLGFAPGFELSNYSVTTATDPLQNVFLEEGLQSPLLHEFSVSYGESLLNGRGHAEASYVFRRTTSLIEDVKDRTTGTTNVIVRGISAGNFTNSVYRNPDTDTANRQYQGLVFQSRYRIRDNVSVNGHYTIQLESDGNYEGEATGQAGNVSAIGDFPEALKIDRFFPDGRLQNFQRHRLRIWSIYNRGMGAFGDVSVSGLWRFEGARAYSIGIRNFSAYTATQSAVLAAAGYPERAPTPNHLYFGGERGTERFPSYGLVDFNINYNIPVFRTVRPWVKFDVYNLFDNRKLIGWNTNVTQDAASPKDSVGLATGFVKGSTFGKATGNTQTNLNYTGIDTFPRAFSGAPAGGRTFRVAVGVRF